MRAFVLVLAGIVLGWVASVAVAGVWSAPPSTTVPSATQPPTVEVEEGLLAEELAFRATVRSAATAPVMVGAFSGEGQAVVTNVFVGIGDQVSAGDVVYEVAGEPVFAIEGTFPLYRTLSPGLRGADVQQVQQALTEMGRYEAEPDSVLGGRTQRAIRLLWEEAGYSDPWRSASPPGPHQFVVVPELPATIAEVRVRTGGVLLPEEAPLFVADEDSPLVLWSADRIVSDLAVGDNVELTDPSGESGAGRIVGIDPTDDGWLLLVDGDVAAGVGTEVRVRHVVWEAPRPSLIVTAAAIAVDTDGAASVRVLDPDSGDIQEVAVDIIGQAGGQVAFESEALAAGDDVVVGG